MIEKLSGILGPSSAAVESAKLLSLTGAARTVFSRPDIPSQACRQGIQHSRSTSEAAASCLAGSKAFHACFLKAGCTPDTSSMSLQHHTAAGGSTAAVPAVLSSKDRSSDAAAQHDCKAAGTKRTLYQQVSSNAGGGPIRKRAASADRPVNTLKPAGMTGSGRRKQAQLGTKGLTDLGQGAQVLYHPGMFDRAEAAEMLTALQVNGLKLLSPLCVSPDEF